jgi:hypothetical protein
LRPLSEAEAYARCYGEGAENVRFVKVEARRPRLFYGVSGEDLRRAFETRLQRREPANDLVAEAVAEAAPEPVGNGRETLAAANGREPTASNGREPTASNDRDPGAADGREPAAA